MLQTMNNVVGGKIKSKAKRRSCPNQSEMDTSSDQYQAKSPRNMSLKLQIHYSLSCTMFDADLINFILLYPATF